MKDEQTYCGYVAIIGRPNVGKSTLLNSILGQKLSITSKKPQTTRYQILGIKTEGAIQAIYVDTPGIHKKSKRVVNRLMNRAASTAIYDVDVIVFMMDARFFEEEDEFVLNKLNQVSCPVILALNKVDLIKHKENLLPIIDALSKKRDFFKIIPLSATENINIDALEKTIKSLLPCQPHFFASTQVTDREDRFIIAETIREKIMRVTNREVPYDTAVTIESIRKEKEILHIDAIIWVERRGQKVIVIGKQGEKLKEIGTQARLDLEKKFNCKIFLSLWIRIKKGWSDSEKLLSEMGIGSLK